MTRKPDTKPDTNMMSYQNIPTSNADEGGGGRLIGKGQVQQYFHPQEDSKKNTYNSFSP